MTLVHLKRPATSGRDHDTPNRNCRRFRKCSLSLSNYPPETPIAAVWEDQRELIYICQGEDGTVLLDVDGGWLAEELAGK